MKILYPDSWFTKCHNNYGIYSVYIGLSKSPNNSDLLQCFFLPVIRSLGFLLQVESYLQIMGEPKLPSAFLQVCHSHLASNLVSSFYPFAFFLSRFGCFHICLFTLWHVGSIVGAGHLLGPWWIWDSRWKSFCLLHNWEVVWHSRSPFNRWHS